MYRVIYAAMIAALFGTSSCNCNTQDNADDFYDKCRKVVMISRLEQKEFLFKRKGNGIDELSLVYIGNIVNNKGDTLRFLNSVNYCGAFVARANAAVYIYNSQNQHLGTYYVGGTDDVPDSTDGQYLVFSFHNNTCNQETRISFADSIPEQIYVRCTAKGDRFYGDLYTFSKAKK